MPLKPSKKTPQPPPSSSSSSNPKASPNPKSPKPPRSPKSASKPKPPTMSKDQSPPESGRKRKSRDADDDDALTILNAVIDFRSKHGGSAPTPTTMKPVFDAVNGSLHRELTFDQLYNKFRSLKHRYYRTVQSGVGPTEFDRAFFDLSVRAWGEKKPKEAGAKAENRDDDDQQAEEDEPEEEKEEEEEEKGNHDDCDSGDSFKYLTDQMTKYFKREGLSLAMLELGLKHMDRSKAAALEKKWREHFQEELRVEAEYCDLKRELLDALLAGQKGANS